ncbi:hypothetical protein ACWEQP_15830 [Streptomyces sp. NPDC004044]
MTAGDVSLGPLRDPGAAGLADHVLLVLGVLWRVSPAPTAKPAPAVPSMLSSTARTRP